MRNPTDRPGPYIEHRNTWCVWCGHIGFSTAFPDAPKLHPSVCCHCRAAGRTMPAVPPARMTPRPVREEATS